MTDLVERVGRSGWQIVDGLVGSQLAQSQLGYFSGILVEFWQFGLRQQPNRRPHLVFQLGAPASDLVHPAITSATRGTVCNKQQGGESFPYQTESIVKLAASKRFDFLGYVSAIETVAFAFHRAQHFGLVLGPGVEIVVVARSVRHRRHA